MTKKAMNYYDIIKLNENLIKKEEISFYNDTSIALLHDNDFMPVVKMGLRDCLKNNVIFYISDLHLDHKILNHFKEKVPNDKIVGYINEIADTISGQFFENLLLSSYLFIAGDVSCCFEISKLFYERLISKRPYRARAIITVLGNHEYWENDRVCDTIYKYKKMFNDLGITFLQNELAYIKGFEVFKISEGDILNSKKGEIAQKCIEGNLLIFGGTGFSGLNPKFNASFGIYRNAIKSIEDDTKESIKTQNVYLKLKEELGNRELIVLTHMPKYDWSSDNYKSNWIYVSGHTHKNEYYKDSAHTVYADNQIGYYNDKFLLKYFISSRKFNIFNNYSDGIYEIDKEDYSRFNSGMGIRMIYNRNDGKIIMLKHSDIYLFLRQKDDSLCLLEGGRLRKLQISDINYYYNNMNLYSKIIKDGTKKFNDFMNKLSNYVRSFGGYGTIHGCIVDIDFLNHIYVNIMDGTIRPYYALSTTFKIPYDNLENLLQDKCPQLYLNYQRLISDKNTLIKNNNNDDFFEPEIYEKTDIYKLSNYMKALQYLIEDNVIRVWDDNLISKGVLLLEEK